MASLFNYVELHTADAAKVQQFYGGLFGWKFEKAPVPDMTYLRVEGEGDARGGVMQEERPPHWLPYVDVADVKATVERAKGLGASVKQPPTPIPGQGQFAVLTDPSGAVFALWQRT